LVECGLDGELMGMACAIIEGIDGRLHHGVFSGLDTAGRCAVGSIVETRANDDASGGKNLPLAIRPDRTIEAHISPRGATWIDRQHLAR
jgi:hypothetical protein